MFEGPDILRTSHRLQYPSVELLREITLILRIRDVNVTNLMVLNLDGSHPHSFSSQAFNALFTPDRPIHFNYHSYRNELAASLSSQPQSGCVTIEAYREEGTTTAPFNMMLANDVSRYHVALRALEGAEQRNGDVRLDFVRLHTDIQQYIYECGQDSPGIHDSPSFQGFTKGVGGGGGGVLSGRLVSTQPRLEDDDPDRISSLPE